MSIIYANGTGDCVTTTPYTHTTTTTPITYDNTQSPHYDLIFDWPSFVAPLDMWDKVLKEILEKYTKETKVPDPIEKVIFNYPATIVFWKDGTKTIVKCQYGEVYDKEKGIALCFMKKFFENKGYFNDIFKKYIVEDE